MQFSISSLAILQIILAATATTALPADAEAVSASSTQQDDAGTTTCFPTMWPSASGVSSASSDSSGIGTSTILVDRSPTPAPSPLKTLPLCCCCIGTPIAVLNQPQPSDIHYLGTCSKAGVRDVCTDQYTGSSGFSLSGFEGQPAKIASACSVMRCGAMMFVD
jgi:hypothetical protein